ncbi:proline iminopeptidase [Lentithecium fluviatile CBS 122367]|uniref:Proline iminopeptidase n=1 Tax=Lentithecium fluviatile CBS 122367 TaxID=1168545 RepID=A0A6G1IEH1_9PLEO|nr:proline iminopeptidase [Lentithecium fluviatile CBS 122367]
MAQGAGYTHADEFDAGDLQVSDLHRIHYAQYGKPDGKPVVFLHGGPGGAGCTKSNTVFFNPAVYRVILLDQRGAGQSEPTAETRENTTQLLIQDIEKLREHVGVKKWHVVFGGSWGSTLTLAYAQAHPEACGSLVLRGVFLGTKAEVDLMDGGKLTGMVWPEEYDRFISYLPEGKRVHPLEAYHELIMSDDRNVAHKAAQEWNRWELSVSYLHQTPGAEIDAKLEDERWVMSHAKMETHYFVNGCFLEPDQLLKGCDKIEHIPTRIAQGRYDLVCPPRAAVAIHKRLPNSVLYWSPQAGHSATEPGTLAKLTEFCDELGLLDLGSK